MEESLPVVVAIRIVAQVKVFAVIGMIHGSLFHPDFCRFELQLLRIAGSEAAATKLVPEANRDHVFAQLDQIRRVSSLALAMLQALQWYW